jgi:hypothetical protein
LQVDPIKHRPEERRRERHDRTAGAVEHALRDDRVVGSYRQCLSIARAAGADDAADDDEVLGGGARHREDDGGAGHDVVLRCGERGRLRERR